MVHIYNEQYLYTLLLKKRIHKMEKSKIPYFRNIYGNDQFRKEILVRIYLEPIRNEN